MELNIRRCLFWEVSRSLLSSLRWPDISWKVSFTIDYFIFPVKSRTLEEGKREIKYWWKWQIELYVVPQKGAKSWHELCGSPQKKDWVSWENEKRREKTMKCVLTEFAFCKENRVQCETRKRLDWSAPPVWHVNPGMTPSHQFSKKRRSWFIFGNIRELVIKRQKSHFSKLFTRVARVWSLTSIFTNEIIGSTWQSWILELSDCIQQSEQSDLPTEEKNRIFNLFSNEIL